jgi:RNA polymerase sigma-70 factor, ECF subfamily
VDFDRNAFGLLAHRYRPRLLKLAMRYTGNFADAEDVVQETFLKAYRALGQFRGEAAIYSWLHRIAVNSAKTTSIHQARRRNLFISCGDSQEMQDASAAYGDPDTPQELALTEELARVLDEAMQRLPDEQRVAIALREIEGLSYSRVADSMSCPVGTVRSRIYRGRDAISDRLRSIFGGASAFPSGVGYGRRGSRRALCG